MVPVPPLTVMPAVPPWPSPERNGVTPKNEICYSMKSDAPNAMDVLRAREILNTPEQLAGSPISKGSKENSLR